MHTRITTIRQALPKARRALPKAFFAFFIAISSLGMSNIASAMEMQSVETGERLNLDDLTGNGKWTLVMFWASTCHICRIQKPDMSAFHDKHKNDTAEVIGIAMDGVDRLDDVKQYIAETNPTFPSYVADGLIVSSYYFGMTEETLRGTPTYLLFSPEGELLGSNPGLLSVEAIENFIERKS